MMWSTIGLFTILLAFVLFLLVFDWNAARPWINQKVSEATGRNFAINGDLALNWQRPQPATDTWRDTAFKRTRCDTE
jgi:uncharacterized protein involved in outer membrane biogenesis